ncbi:UPF0182 family protein, partial [Candidatus Micrarchaeota archaeon]
MALPKILDLYGDYLWFLSLGFEDVFLKILFTKLLITSIGTALVFFPAFLSFKKAVRNVDKIFGTESSSWIFPYLILGISLIVAYGFASFWETPLMYLNQVPFGLQDPVFGNDISFYVFSVPFYKYILIMFFSSLVVTSLFTGFVYFFSYSQIGEEVSERVMKKLRRVSVEHFTIVGSMFLLLLGSWIYLSRFDLLFSVSGAAFGAGYTDVTVKLPYLTLLSIILMVSGITLLFRKWDEKYLKYLPVLILGIVVLGGIATSVTQSLIVKPDEFNKERPFIERSIDYTIRAYGLDRMMEKQHPGNYNLTMEDIKENSATIDNIRLWDWRPLLKTYNQLQIFRTYYQFSDVDIDRYHINGVYKQVMLSPREMDTDKLPARSRTWVNKHLVYTHGYGLVMSPARDVTEEGLPELYIKDIPPVSISDDLKVEEPRIYYGEQTDEYVIVRSGTKELDYPSGEKNVYTTYEGKGGVELSSPFRRLIYALKFGAVQILVSDSVKPESRILFNRNIRERVRTVAPFLMYDNDPYMVLSDGKLYWIYDAYTTTDLYPYSEPVRVNGRTLNYIRNSVKIIMDAYNGNMRFYVYDDSDPVLNTWRRIFPSLFLSRDEMPESLRSHVRYPEDMFLVQAHIYSVYHMKDPRVFYNKEDVWVIPDEIYRGGRQKMEPYYIIMQIPNGEKEEFIELVPFVPKGKQNMIGWMAARPDEPNYGELVTFLFPKQKLVYGPLQVEARIDQDPEISERITLWSQIGSEVIRGNLFVIPIEDSILYVEPLFLQASQDGSLPEMKRVIVVFGNRVAMKPTFEEALKAVFSGETREETGAPPQEEMTLKDLVKRAGELY